MPRGGIKRRQWRSRSLPRTEVQLELEAPRWVHLGLQRRSRAIDRRRRSWLPVSRSRLKGGNGLQHFQNDVSPIHPLERSRCGSLTGNSDRADYFPEASGVTRQG